MYERLKEQLIRHEGLSLKPYRDTVGKLTIGVGRNLDDRGITKEEALSLLDNDIREHTNELLKALPWIMTLDEPRRDVLFDMAFNMGVPGLLTFKNTLDLIKSGKYKEAAENMLKSKWASQVGNRADYLAKVMETGEA